MAKTLWNSIPPLVIAGGGEKGHSLPGKRVFLSSQEEAWGGGEDTIGILLRAFPVNSFFVLYL